uniref:Uncharacterized protein n=1 Tax=Pseudictyota dubia TaxID=2749911 RepID=A0A7R9VPB4_9STRA
MVVVLYVVATAATGGRKGRLGCVEAGIFAFLSGDRESGEQAGGAPIILLPLSAFLMVASGTTNRSQENPLGTTWSWGRHLRHGRPVALSQLTKRPDEDDAAGGRGLGDRR